MTFCFLSLSGGEGVWHFCFPSLSLGDFCCLSCVLLGLRLTKDLLLFGYEKQMLEWDPPPNPSVGPQVPVVVTDFLFQVFVCFSLGQGAVLLACGVSVPQPGIRPRPPAWGLWSLTPGPPGQSLFVPLLVLIYLFRLSQVLVVAYGI